ncbi:MAG: hypothetical protein HY055_05490 [Magnetospirillum sp.]|nr:hypothetical protein [Magnetospirillum sp.]
MTRKKVHLVDLVRLTTPGDIDTTIAKAQPFFGKKAGGWAYRSFRTGVHGTLSGSSIHRSGVMKISRGRGPQSCQNENSIVAGLFFDKYQDLRGHSDFLKDFFLDFNGVLIVASHIAIVQNDAGLHLIYVQPRKGYCPNAPEHIARIKAFITQYVVPSLDQLIPRSIFSRFDASAKIHVEVFDAGTFHLKRKERWPRRYRQGDGVIGGRHSLNEVIQTFCEAYSRLPILPAPETRTNPRRKPPPPSDQLSLC